MLYNRILWQHSKKVLARHSHVENVLKVTQTFSVQRRQFSDGLLHIHPSVSSALSSGKPVVALESTIITHGLPYPHNLKTARLVESVVRENNATPATIAILDGKIHVGLTDEQLERIATCKKSVKVSRRDFAPVLAKGQLGGTTVSATMVIAHKAGIPVFVTGGIGGVHRGAETTMDVSADLTELGRTPVAVVSAGVKSILDIGLTLEYLETEGVTIATYGETKDFPAFFTSKSGHKVPYNVETPREAAQLIAAGLSLNLQSGVLIAVPIPEDEAPAGKAIEEAIQHALIEAKGTNVQGKEVTPFVLQRVMELTQGKSLEANIILIKNNAKVGSQIACELAKIQSPYKNTSNISITQSTHTEYGTNTTHSNTSLHSATTEGSLHSANSNGSLHSGNTDGSLHSANSNGSLHSATTDASLHSGNTDASLHSANSNGSLHSGNTNDGLHTANSDDSLHSANSDGSLHSANSDDSLHLTNSNGSLHSGNTDGSLHPVNSDGSLHSGNAKGSLHSGNTASQAKRKGPGRPTTQQPRPVVIGACIVDFMTAITSENVVFHGTTNPGTLKQTYGGVARNLADCLSRLDESPIFISAVGDDSHGDNLINYCNHMDTSYIQRLAGQQTATYCVVLESSGECLLGIGDTDIPLKMTPDFMRKFEREICQAPLVCMDANIPSDTIEYVCDLCRRHGIPVWFEPTCVKKSKKLFQSEIWKTVSYVSPNVSELKSMCSMLDDTPDNYMAECNSIDEMLPLCDKLLKHIHCVVLTLGKDGVLVCRNTKANEPFHVGNIPSNKAHGLVSAVHYPTISTSNITSVSGAGDCLASCIIHGILRGYSPSNCIQGGLRAASFSLQSHHAVPATIETQEFTLEKIAQWGQTLRQPTVYHSQ